MWRSRGLILDTAVAAIFVVVGQLVAWRVIHDSNTAPHGSRLGQSALYFALDALVIFWRRAPLAARAVMLPVGIVETALSGTSSFFAGSPRQAGCSSVSRRSSPRRTT